MSRPKMGRVFWGAVALAAALVACGIKGSPRPPLREEPVPLPASSSPQPTSPDVADAGCEGCTLHP